MFKNFSLLMLLVLVLSFGTSSWAEDVGPSDADIQISCGSSSKIYDKIASEIIQTCGGEVSMSKLDSSGAIENLDNVLSNNANAALLHSDVLYSRAKTEDLSNIKTLLALFPEDVHFLTLNKPYVVDQGAWGLNKKSVILENISDLANLPVGASGGGFITANTVRLQSEIPYKIIQFDSGSQVMQALNDGRIAVAVYVGPAPLPNLEKLDQNYKLLYVPDNVVDRLKSVYKKSSIVYTHMSPLAVQTISADDLLITRNYRSKEHVDALLKLRSCVEDNIDHLKEKRGFHKAWQKVDINNHGKCWVEGTCWYEGTSTVSTK